MVDASGSALVQLREVSRSYGDRQVLRSVTMHIVPGECVVVTGDNGSGKSTLLRLASGRERPTSGTVLFDGVPIDEDDPATRARIATVMDAGAHYPDLTVREHLMLVALSHGLGAGAESAVEAELQANRLSGHADLLPSVLSSGQAQSLMLAVAFVRPHELLVLDEPEQRLDAHARKALAHRLEAHRDAGAAILLATHHSTLTTVADRVLRLDDGKPFPVVEQQLAGRSIGSDR